MDQPDLGKRIVELRKAKGLTQEELVEKCNVSVRTLQRIESGEVSPRSYTLRIIFAALDYDVNDLYENNRNKSKMSGFIPSDWLEQFYRYVFDLFNLKTNTMKKISILSVLVFAASFILLTVRSSESKAQTTAKVKKTIEESSKNFVKWFNNGQIDSVMTLYKDDACIVTVGCGKAFISDYYKSMSIHYKYNEISVSSITVGDAITIEKGDWSISSNSGEETKGEYLTEWRLINNKWLIHEDRVMVKPE